MLATDFVRNLRDQRRALVGWCIGVAAVVAVTAAIRPFLDVELFTFAIPALFLTFAIGLGARPIAGGKTESVPTTPATRARSLLSRAAVLATSVLVLGATLFGAILGVGVAGLDVTDDGSAAASLAMVVIGLTYGWLALAIGAASGRRRWAVAVPTTLAILGYLLYTVGQFVDDAGPWTVLSPFHHVYEAGPMGFVPAGYAVLALAGLVIVAAALPTSRAPRRRHPAPRRDERRVAGV